MLTHLQQAWSFPEEVKVAEACPLHKEPTSLQQQYFPIVERS